MMGQGRRGDDGATVLELVVALAVFAVAATLAAAVLTAASRTERRAVLAADAQQQARLALERLARELREAGADEVLTGGRPEAMWVLFKSARLAADPGVFCLHASATSAPADAYRRDCFTFPGGDLPEPRTGTYTPIWQRYVGYFVAPSPGGGVLRRVAGALPAPGAPLDPAVLIGGETMAEGVEAFDVAVAGRAFTAVLRTRPAEASGAPSPREIHLYGAGLIRN